MKRRPAPQPAPLAVQGLRPKSLPGAQVRAPFPGTIFNWNVVTPGPYSYQLVVLRKRRNGKFKDVGESHPGATPGAGAY